MIILCIIFFYCFLVTLDYNYLYSITKMQKKPYNQGFSLLIHTKLSRLLPAKQHTQRDAFAEKGPPAGLSSTRSPTLDRV